MDIAQEIEALEARVVVEPDSPELRENLMELYLSNGQGHSARRLEHVLWYVRHYPRNRFASCPLAHLERAAAPGTYDAVEQSWREHIRATPDEPRLVQGLALFIAHDDRDGALRILRDFLREHPTEADVWIDLGRIATDDKEQLAAFQTARTLGSVHSNLVAWIGRSAIKANDIVICESAARELLELVATARGLHGDRLDWPEHGSALFARARALTSSRAEAAELTRAISSHAFHKHWGHTLLGMVSLRAGRAEEAADHLMQSAAMPGDFRLSSYGPSFILAQALCEHGAWFRVADYLDACKAFWDPEQLETWRQDVLQQRLPEFPGT